MFMKHHVGRHYGRAVEGDQTGIAEILHADYCGLDLQSRPGAGGGGGATVSTSSCIIFDLGINQRLDLILRQSVRGAK